MPQGEELTYRVKTDGFFGELFRPAEDNYPGKALICFSGSDGGIALARMLAGVFQTRGLTTLALAYVMEEGLPQQFSAVPIDCLEAAARRLHQMGYEKVGLWGISKGAELALTAGSLLPGLVNGVVAVAPMNTVCQGFVKDKGAQKQLELSWERTAVQRLQNRKIPPGVRPVEEPADGGADHVRPVPAHRAAAGPGRRDPGGEDHRPGAADLLEAGHHVAVGARGGADHEAPAGASLPVFLPASEL